MDGVLVKKSSLSIDCDVSGRGDLGAVDGRVCFAEDDVDGRESEEDEVRGRKPSMTVR